MQAVLRESNEARGFTLVLQGAECSNELLADMQGHAEWLASAFRIIKGLVDKKINVQEAYDPVFKKIEQKQEWYKLRRASLLGLFLTSCRMALTVTCYRGSHILRTNPILPETSTSKTPVQICPTNCSAVLVYSGPTSETSLGTFVCIVFWGSWLDGCVDKHRSQFWASVVRIFWALLES